MYVAVPPGYHQRLCRLGLSPLAMVVALAMRSFDGHVMTGLHQLQAELRVLLVGDFHAQGMTAAKAAEVIEELINKGFWRYSDRVLWVCDQAEHVGTLRQADKRAIHIQKHVNRIGPGPVVTAFVERYRGALGVSDPSLRQPARPSPVKKRQPAEVEPLELELAEPDRKPKDGITEEQWVELEKAMFAARKRVNPKARKSKFTEAQRKEAKQVVRIKKSHADELEMVILRMGESLGRWAEEKPDEAHRARANCTLSHLKRGTNYERYRDNDDLDVELRGRGPPRNPGGFKGNPKEAFKAAGGNGWNG